jgi:ribosomal protein S18 acetylase RimI-like enzyme
LSHDAVGTRPLKRNVKSLLNLVSLALIHMLITRKAERKDCASIAHVHTSAIRAISNSLYTPEEIEAWAVPRTPESYQQSIRSKEFYVAVEDDLIVGFGVLNQESREIEAVYVSPDVRRRGVGLMILGLLEERARALGLEVLSLNASLNAVRFYKRAGYVAQEGAKYRLPSGVEIPCVPMVKRIMLIDGRQLQPDAI